MMIQPQRPAIVIQTRKGNDIPCEPPRLPMSPAEVTYQRRAIETWKQKDRRPGEVRERRRPSYDYNCHGLTFLSRRAWLQEADAALRQVLTDDGYREVPLNAVLPGDIVLYRDRAGQIEHTGVVTSVDGEGPLRVLWVVSKWGASGEYIHPFNKSPYTGTPHFMREGADEFTETDH
jgi:hypothetical protein